MPAKYHIRTSFDVETLPRLTDEELEPHTIRYLGGDKNEKAIIIESNMRLALSIAAMFASRYPFRADDLGGQAMFMLCQAVDKFPDKARDTKIRGYLHNRVWHGLQRYCREDHLIRVASSTLHYQKQRGKEIRFEVEDIDKVLYGKEKRPDRKLLDLNDQTLPIENLELMNVEVITDTEILRLRLIGFNDQEIADATCQTLAVVINRRKEIVNRLTFVLRKLEC